MTAEEAIAGFAAGRSVAELAAEAGVSYMTVYRWVHPEYRQRENEIAKSKPRVKRVTPTQQLEAEITSLRTELAKTKSSLAASRKLASRYKHERDQLTEQLREIKPFNLTELHEYWLATKTPREIVRISQGLSGWEDVAA